MATKSYAGAAWNHLMEEETKESIAKFYLDSIDTRRYLLTALKGLVGGVDADGSDKPLGYYVALAAIAKAEGL